MRERVDQRTFADLELLRQGVVLDPVLGHISRFLDEHPEFTALVEADLRRGLKCPKSGRNGLSVEQTLRSLVLQRIKNWSLRELRERIHDGLTLRLFTRFEAQPVPRHVAFQSSFSRLRPETLHALNDVVITAAVEAKLEDGRALRVDTTVVESDIHYPTDSHLLWDCVRVLTRIGLDHLGAELPGAVVDFPDRRRRAKRRFAEISRLTDRQGQNRRSFRRKYKDLVAVTEEVVAKARVVAEHARQHGGPLDLIAAAKVDAALHQIAHYAELAERVIDQTRRRIFKDEKLSAEEKIYSIFEPHTDLIKRGKRRTPVEFGHKVFLAESKVGLITEFDVLDGNPVDTTNVDPSLEHHEKLFATVPDLYAGDRGFDGREVRSLAEQKGVRNFCVPQRGGKLSPEQEREQKTRAFRKGQAFRSGIEGTISVLFRGRGMRRCLLEGPERFEVFVGACVLAANLLRIGTLLERRKRKRHPPLRRAA